MNRRSSKHVLRFCYLTLLALAIGAPGADAQDSRGSGLHGIGPRLGLTIDPDQIHIGAHVDLGDVARRVALIPNVEVGFGDDFQIIAIMAEFDYRFPVVTGSWRPYAGGGIGPVFISFDGGRDDTELGITAQGGFARENASGNMLFLELKLGLIDAPDAKVTIGWTFVP